VCRLIVVLVAVLLAACGPAGDEGSVEGTSAERLVLQAEDLPGYRDGPAEGDGATWNARYVRSGASAEAPLQVESSAEISDSSDGARENISVTRGALRERDNWQPIGEPGLGDESFAATSAAGATRSYEVVWRDGNVMARLSVVGSESELAFADVLALAEKQEERILEAQS
jgi:hypothetical protein